MVFSKWTFSLWKAHHIFRISLISPRTDKNSTPWDKGLTTSIWESLILSAGWSDMILGKVPIVCVCACVCVCERERARACIHMCLCLEGILQSLEAVFRIGCSDYRKGCCGRFYGHLGSQGWVPFLNWRCGTPASPFHFDAEAAWNFGSSVWESRTAEIIQVRATLRS